MSESNAKRVKKSFIAGSLTSSAGVFVSKVIGLFYVVPYTAMATEENMVYYSNAYSLYNTLLQVCSAGLPFAIAAIVAKYADREDYKTVLLVRRLGTGMLSVFGFTAMMLFALSSGFLARSGLGPEALAEDIHRMQTSYVILSVALFLVPILYSYRGFYQGFKELRVYADSQVLEQLVRVLALLGLSWICVYALHLDRIWAIYMGVASTSIGALAAILYYIRFDRGHIGAINRAARAQREAAVEKKEIVRELVAFGLPYLIVGVLGNSQALINAQFFIPTASRYGMKYEDARLMLSIIQLQCDKITSIPQVLSIGFSTGVVPYLTVSYEHKDWSGLQKNVRDCLDTVFYIALPLCYCIFALARPIYYIMYGGANLDAGEHALEWSALLALATTISPICNSMMLTLHQRKESILYLAVGFAVKCATFVPLIKYTGYIGAITSSVLCSLSIIYLSLARLSASFHIHYGRTFKRAAKMGVCCLCMQGAFSLLRLAGLGFSESSRLAALGELVIYGAAGMGVYLWTTSLMQLPQAIFHSNVRGLFKRILQAAKRRGAESHAS
jgi:O-antigen/teichoic acid export membrane protein